jgi:excisionase family DNA binding protein
MIDLASEKLITIDHAAEKLLVSKVTIVRWITHGAKGIKLEAMKFGSHWRTSEEALQRFGERSTEAPEPSQCSIPTRRDIARREREVQEADEELRIMLGLRQCDTCHVPLDFGHIHVPQGSKDWCPKCLVQRKGVSIGKRIFVFRASAKLSQSKLANRCGFSIDSVRAWESGEKSPSAMHLAKLVEVLGGDLVHGISVP